MSLMCWQFGNNVMREIFQFLSTPHLILKFQNFNRDCLHSKLMESKAEPSLLRVDVSVKLASAE